MQYLNAAEFIPFGLGEETADDLVVAASTMIDAFCRRPTLGITQYVERLRFARGRNAIQLSNLPLAAATNAPSAIVSARLRFGRQRVSESCDGGSDPWIAEVSAFAPAGTWTNVDPSTLDVSPSGVLTFAPHLLGVTFHEAEITYTAGFAEVPVPVKVACAQIVRNAQATPALNVRRQAVDTMTMEYFTGALLDIEVQRLLKPYVAERMG
jgi:hypothetical protein